MTKKGKIGALGLMTLSALLLAFSGKLWMAFGLWLMVLYLIYKIERDTIKRTAFTYEAKLFFCMEPETYLMQIERTAEQLIFRHYWEPTLKILRNTVLLFKQDQPLDHSLAQSIDSLNAEAFRGNLNWPLNTMTWLTERQLINGVWYLLEKKTPEDVQQAKQLLEMKGIDWTPTGLFYQLNYYRHGVENQSDYKKKLLDQTINKGDVYPFNDEFIWLWTLTAYAKISLESQNYEASLKLLHQLRESEPYNFLFGEINELLGDVYAQLNDGEKSILFYQTALNFSEGLFREKRIVEKLSKMNVG